MHPDWARSLRDQCQAAGVAFHFKQHGEWLHGSQKGAVHSGTLNYLPITMGETHNWPDRSFSAKIGKKKAGRILDGRTWDEFPRVD